MNFTNRQKIITIVLVVLVLIGLYVIFDGRQKNTEGSVATSTPFTTSTSTPGVQVQGTGGYTIEQIPLNNIPMPDLSRPLTKSSNATVSLEALAFAMGKVSSLQASLKKNNADFPAWLDLAMYQKMGGDFMGASLSWQYAAQIAPTSYIPLGNLGDLYAYFLHDTAKAEMYYKQAISRDPKQAYLYIQLGGIYRDLESNITKAREIADQGLSQIPNDPNLLQFKAGLK